MVHLRSNKTVETGKKYYWYSVTAPNGETLVASEPETRKANIVKSIRSLIKVMGDPNLKIIDETNPEYHF